MRSAALTLALLLALPAPGQAYETATTHPGLTAQAVLSSRLHRFLRQELGLELGLFSRLSLDGSTMDRRELRRLQRSFARLDPAGGYRPDDRAAHRAIGWVLSGNVLAGMPAAAERHHFYCPPLRRGLDNSNPLVGTLVRLLSTLEGGNSAREFLTGTAFDLTGLSALEWRRSPENPHASFYEHLAAAVSGATAEERGHRLTLALLSLGGQLHLLQDMASPTHVRDDFATGHLEQLGGSTLDRGSAYERYVARRFGQFALPTYRGEPITRARLEQYFSSPRWNGLADRTSVDFFSPGTLPPTVPLLPDSDPRELRGRLAGRLPLARPALGPLRLDCARQRTCYQEGQTGPLLAYRVDAQNRLRFFLDGRCHEAAARQLLPLAVGYSTGLIDHYLRGRITIEREADGFLLKNAGASLGSARVQILAEDGRGRRSPLLRPGLRLPAPRGAILSSFAVQPPTGSRALVVLLAGVDEHGEPLVATARFSLAAPPSSAPATAPSSAPASQPAPATGVQNPGNQPDTATRP